MTASTKIAKRKDISAGHVKLTISVQMNLASGDCADIPVSPSSFVDRVISAAKKLIALDLGKASPDHQVFQENLRYALGPYVIVDGEWCRWQEDETLGIVVKREPWSLLGTGETLKEAIADYRQEAQDLACAMQHDNSADLTDEARRMQDAIVSRYLPTDA